jgi:hypothetical protein
MPTVSNKKKKLRGIEQGCPDGVVIDRHTGEYLLTKIRYSAHTAAFILDVSVAKIYEYLAENREGYPSLQAACQNGHKTKPMKITRESILKLHAESLVPKEKWNE